MSLCTAYVTPLLPCCCGVSLRLPCCALHVSHPLHRVPLHCRVPCVLLRQLWSDIRYQSLPEDRRQALFAEYMSEVQQQAAAASAAQAAAAAAAAASSNGSSAAATPADTPASASASASSSSLSTVDLDPMLADTAGMETEDLAKLQLLRWEQSRLRQQYMQMEEQLRKMEAKIRSGASSPVADMPAAAAVSESNEQLSAAVAAAAAAAETAAAAEVAEATAAAGAAVGAPVDVVVEGGAGDVSVEVNRDGVVVFKFAEEALSRSGSRRSSPEPGSSSGRRQQ